MRTKESIYLLLLLLCPGMVALAQTGTPDDEILWKKLDWNPDGQLDGKELEGGWVKYDTSGDNEVTKAEFLSGRAKERGGQSAPPRTAPKPAVKPAPKPAPKPSALPKVSPRPGRIVGAVGTAGGVRLGKVSIEVSGFEDGKLANRYASGALAETINKTTPITGSTYGIPVPAGAYRARAYSTHSFQGKTYHFPLELVTNPVFDYKALGLEKLRGGLVRSFVLKLTGPKKGENAGSDGYTETTYRHAFYGGRIDFYADTAEGNARSLRNTYPPESRLLVTLTPLARVDGSAAGQPLLLDLRLGDDGTWTFNQRGVVPGTYSATARLRTPDGNERPLRISAVSGYKFPGTWQTSATFTFQPETLGPSPRMGVEPIRFYLME